MRTLETWIGGRKRRHVTTVCLLLSTLLAVPAGAQQTSSCDSLIDTAQRRYVNGAFAEVIQLVSECLNRPDPSDEMTVEAYRLLSLAHLKQNELEAARKAIINLLAVEPAYEPNPVEDPPTYVSMVSIVKEEVKPQLPVQTDDESAPFLRRTTTWLTFGGAVLVGSAVAFLTIELGGQGALRDDPLPPPPGNP